ncbi:MAG TPA: hypothetical protein VKM55_28165 [Candidatus Lokiarchaeia archaeon]|nr:hypothetical protein [Candidatus Lokiarchaeia archaeon]
MATIKKKSPGVRCPWCKVASSLVYEENDLEYCLACLRCFTDPLKNLLREKSGSTDTRVVPPQ